MRTIEGYGESMTGSGRGRTQRNESEQPQRAHSDSPGRSEEHFRHLVEDINDVLFALCDDGTIDYISPALTTLAGYLPEKVIGRNFAEFVHPDDLEDVIASFRRVVAGAVEPSEFRIVHRDGSIRWVRSSSRRAWLYGGVSGTRGVLTDVTERRRTEELLRENEARFRTLSETTAAITFIHRDENLLYVNPAATAVTGFTREELLASNFWDLIHPSLRELARSRSRERMRGALLPDRAEIMIVTKSGEERWVDFTAATIDYMGEKAVLGTAFDITDRKSALEALRSSERRFRALIERSSDAVTLMDENAIIRYVSPNIARLLGHDDHELIGRDAFDLVHPDDIEPLQEIFRDLLAELGKSVTVAYRYRHKDGSWRWLEAVATSLRSEIEGGTVIVNNRDVTDRRLAEEEARHRQAELAHVLRLHVVNEMASSLMHEINQPLAAIVNYARGSLMRLDQDTPVTAIRQALREIANQGIRVGDIVRSLKRFVRKEPPHETHLEVNQLIENVLRLVDSDAKQLGIALRRTLIEPSPCIRGDRVQLEQVILNLVRNGIEAIQARGASGRIAIETSRPDESTVAISVSDDGGGVPNGTVEKIFEPFFTTKPSGLGMGLAITRTIVEAHGGRIWAEPSPQGMTFRLTLRAA